MQKVIFPRSRLAIPGAVVVALMAAAPAVEAATRLVILPVVVSGGPDPDPVLMSALAEGLRQNPQWAVEQGESVPSLATYRPVGLTDAEVERLSTELEGALKRGTAGHAEELATLERVRTELRAASKKGPRGAKGDDLLWRAGVAIVNGLATKDPARARTVAEETVLLLPGRKPVEADKLSPAAAELFKTSPELGARLKLLTRPEGCEVFLDGRSYGRAPVEVAVLHGETYWANSRCAPGAAAPGAAATAGGGGELASLPKKVGVPTTENERQELLDAEFERAFAAESFRRLRFGSAQERRQVEESYARRAAERFDADAVVLASVGELSGADWLNARLYLRSGFLNRHGLVRLEAQRANALGRYLATGKDVPGVLKPEEAGAMVAAARRTEDLQPTVSPWYTDIAGWCFLGAGLATFSWGRWMVGNANEKQTEADESRGDSAQRSKLYEDAQDGRFWGGVGTVGGLLLMSTGVVLLLVPEYNNTEGELFAVSPSLLPGGGGLVLGGRF